MSATGARRNEKSWSKQTDDTRLVPGFIRDVLFLRQNLRLSDVDQLNWWWEDDGFHCDVYIRTPVQDHVVNVVICKEAFS